MRKVFLFMMVTLDGYYEGPNQDISWHNVDEEFNEFAIEQLSDTDTLLFGRKTYDMMAAYWPTEAAKTDDPVVSGFMNSLQKVVFSKSLPKADWENTTLVREKVEDEIGRLKAQPGGDIAIFGSSGLAAELATAGLIDEYRIMVNPVVLGQGSSLLAGIGRMLKLRLTKSRTFKSGNVLLYYQPPQ
jgi:dihydrofolate reductase